MNERRPHRLARILKGLMLGALACSEASAADWPGFRYDAQRTAASPEELAGELHLLWMNEYPPPHPAWQEPLNQQRMGFDLQYEPIVLGKTMYFASSREDCLVAVNTTSGDERWRFHIDGPLRLPPFGHRGNVYCSGDDGYLYCVAAETGKLRWRFRGGPSDRKLLGNERLISAWPARGGPVADDGVVYFAAGIWPFMGTFIHALDAETGKVLWTNDTSGSRFLLQPKRAPSFAGVGPQGPLVLSGEMLLVPGGRTVPGAFDRATGRFRYYHAEGYRGSGPVTHRVYYRRLRYTGGSTVSAIGKYFFNDAYMFDLATGGDLKRIGKQRRVLDGNVMYLAGDPVTAIALDTFRPDGPKPERGVQEYTYDTLWTAPLLETEVMIKAGPRLYAAGDAEVVALDLPKGERPAQNSWRGKVIGTVGSIVAADEKLFVSTRAGRIYCFGPQRVEPTIRRHQTKPPSSDPQWAAKADQVLAATRVDAGYCLVLGAGEGGLVEALADKSELRLIVLEAEANRAVALRKRLHAAGLHPPRVSVHAISPQSNQLPPYLASLIVSEDVGSVGFATTDAFVERVFHSLRPYGGVACFDLNNAQRQVFAEAVKDKSLSKAKLSKAEGMTLLAREGALEGAGRWTHQYADAGNTNVSEDSRVKLPLGLLWFGGSSHEATLPRHGRPPPPQVLDGRIIVEGPGGLRAIDAFTGRVLWDASLPGLGKYFDTVIHQPGAIALGGNYVTVDDSIYVAYGASCVRLDPATGQQLGEFRLPPDPNSPEKPPELGYLNAVGQRVILGVDPNRFEGSTDLPGSNQNIDLTSSRRLAVLDGHTGDVLWQRPAALAFRHNSIAVGSRLIFVIDHLPERELERLTRRGERLASKPRLLALDLETGKEQWSTTDDVSGPWVGYSQQRDILVVSTGSTATAYQGRTGKPLWSARGNFGSYRFMLHGDKIISQTEAYSLLTGERLTFNNPITGEPVPWTYTRNGEIGCTNAVACQNLITFRSGAVGYFDLERGRGMGTLGGFRPSCTNNVIAADGLLVAPDYTRTCKCAYQNQTSLALIHMPEIETWTEIPYPYEPAPVKRLGINFGAPGDRLADDGTLWIEHPVVGGRTPAIDIHVEPAEATYVRRHESGISGDGASWVVASGAAGVKQVQVTLVPADAAAPGRYTVSLYFAVPDDARPGQRICHLGLQGKTVLENFDAAKEGADKRILVKRFQGIVVDKQLTLTLQSANGAGKVPVLGGLEVRLEE